MSTTESSATECTGTAEDVELLATRLMGWKRPEDLEDAMPGCWHDDSGPVAWMFNMGRDPWNPYVSADADVQVLERVREVWSEDAMADFSTEYRRHARGLDFGQHIPFTMRYTVGAWARAALAVLKEMEKTEEGR